MNIEHEHEWTHDYPICVVYLSGSKTKIREATKSAAGGQYITPRIALTPEITIPKNWYSIPLTFWSNVEGVLNGI